MIEVGYDPSNVKAAEELVKKKNADIVAFRNQPKLPPTEHPHAKEIVQEANKKYEMMNLIVHMIAKIKEMEIEMDKLVQEKEAKKPKMSLPLLFLW